MSGAPDPRPTKRHRASKDEWEDMRLVFRGSRCRICGGEWSELHHVLPRDGNGPWPGGDDVVLNLTPLCSDCHRRVEDRDLEARAALRASLTEGQRWYLTARLGARAGAWLDRHLPEVTA